MRLGSKMRMHLSQTPNNPLAVRAAFGADNETTAIGRWTWSIQNGRLSGGSVVAEVRYNAKPTICEALSWFCRQLNSSKAAVHAGFIDSWNRPSKAQLHFHGPAPVACQFEGRLHLVETVAARQQRLHVDGPPVDEVDGETELLVKSERPAHLDLRGDHRVLGNGYVAAEPELQQHAARLQHIETGADRSLVAGCLELHVEITLICSVSPSCSGSFATLMVRSAPTCCAFFSTASIASVATISRAPCARAAMMVSAPIGPQPVTRTRLPSSEPARATACRVTANGSAKAASLLETPSLTLWHCHSSATRRWRNAP